MSSLTSFPYEAIAAKRYKSPHKNDLSFAKGDRIRVLSLAPKDEDDDEDEDDEEPDQWLVGETLDGTKTGTFPASHVQAAPAAEESQQSPAADADVVASAPLSTIKSPEEDVSDKTPTKKDETKVVEPVVEAETQPTKEVTPAAVPQVADIKAEEDAPAAILANEPEEAAPLQVAAAVSQKPTSPTIAPKPGGLAARIAAFNKPQEAAAPPPLPRGKPGGWKRPAPAPGAAKPVMPASPAAQQAKPTSAAPPPATAASPPIHAEEEETGASSRTNAGFSAADAQSSIKMSLKERMAALQRGESSDAAASKPIVSAPKPAPGRIAEEKRRAALAGMGGQAAVPKAEEAQAVDRESIVNEGEDSAAIKAVETEEEDVAAAETKEVVSSAEGETEGGEEKEQTEEEKESERRAAIAKRMASLGGRRMGGGPAIFGGPAPVPARKPTAGEAPSTPIVTSEEAVSEEPSALSGPGTSREIEQEPDQPGKTLAVPRRAAPPRKKKGSVSSVKTADSVGSAPQEVVNRQDSKASIESGLEKQVEGGSTSSKTATGIASGAVAGEATGARILEGNHSLTEDPTSVDVASSYGDHTSEFEPGTPISEGQMDENARQLEEFIRTPREEEKIALGGAESGIHDSPLPLTAMPPIPVTSPPPPSHNPPSSIGRPPSSRPPSTRPPIPKGSMLEEGVAERITSPAPTRAPPVPAAGRRESILQTSSEGKEEVEDDEDPMVQQPTILAKPKPRMAVPAELSDDEEEEEGKEKEIEVDPRGTSAMSPAVPEVGPVAPNSEELTEEEEDRQRRARISAKMARMGGQPIMGAPIAFKNPSVSEPAPLSEDYMVKSEREELPEEDEEEAFISPPAPSRPNAASPPPMPTSISPPPPIRQTTSPPIPSKSPPPPMSQGSGSGSGSALEKRLSQMNLSEDGSSLTRRASLLSRPPVPIGRDSREASTDIDEDMAHEQSEVITPPALPSSPPPRAPPARAPPRQPSQAEEEDVAAPTSMPSSSEGSRRRSTLQQQQQVPRSTSRETMPRSSRDLDLMPSSRWWRHGLPVKLPPTLLRPDANPLVTIQDQEQQHLIRIQLIFEDYSATVVEVIYEDDDATEEATQLSQHHSFAPRRPSSAELQSWSQRYGAPIAKQALSALQAKSAVGNGSSKDFITALMAMTSNEEVLPSVGSSFGSIILAQAATTPVDVGADEIRMGDIVALHGVDFKGKKGLSSYHATFGSAQEPTYACVVESEAKKRKLRCILVAGVEGKRNRTPEEVSLRLDDVKSGLLRIFRLAPKSGWLSM